MCFLIVVVRRCKDGKEDCVVNQHYQTATVSMSVFSVDGVVGEFRIFVFGVEFGFLYACDKYVMLDKVVFYFIFFVGDSVAVELQDVELFGHVGCWVVQGV